MASTNGPKRLTIRAYQVGFGDCFLLTFHYKTSDRHVLIDFGSTGLPKNAPKDLMASVAEDIAAECGGKLHAVVATHRHKDHISGFATNAVGTGTGDVIAGCNPDVVVQPWTEAPDADPLTGEVADSHAGRRAFGAALRDMHAVSASVLREVDARRGTLGRTLTRELEFLGDDNLTNRSAVENLMRMGQNGKAVYVHAGSSSGLGRVLPGVKTHVLGPPTLRQAGDSIRVQRSRDEAEYWHFQARAAKHSAASGKEAFPGAEAYAQSSIPAHTRWFVKRMKAVRGEQLLGIMRALDGVMNNTSVILVFEAGSKTLLFPGDAQIENWSYSLFKPSVQKLLAKTDVYKVGHHGSLNATPKTLWNLFEHRGPKGAEGRLQTVVSTMPGKHGKTDNNTEVPRRPLVTELEARSDYFSTMELTRLKSKREFRKDIVLDLA